MRNALLVINPRARRGQARIEEAVRKLESLGVRLRKLCIGAKQNLESAISSQQEAVDLVIAAGGDGTINAALPVLVHGQVPLGILPLGTANNVSRTLEIPLDLEAACELVVRGAPVAVDVGVVNGRYFLTTASMGLSVRITRALSSASKRRWGRLAYLVAAARSIRRARTFRAQLILPSRRIATRSVQIVVGNGLYYGTRLRVADDAEMDDHLLDVLSVEADRWWRLLRVLPSLKKGDHEKRSDVVTLRTRSIRIETDPPMKINVDGELIGSTPATVEVLPNALRVIAGPRRPRDTPGPTDR